MEKTIKRYVAGILSTGAAMGANDNIYVLRFQIRSRSNSIKNTGSIKQPIRAL